VRHTFRFGTGPRPAWGEGDEAAGDLDDHLFLFDVSEGVEHLLRNVYEGANRGGPVTRLADMSPEKQAEIHRLYPAPSNVDLFLSRLRAGPRVRCSRMLATMKTAEIQGFEALVGRDERFTALELRETRVMINAEVTGRTDRGERV
jgi:hypothetical protein